MLVPQATVELFDGFSGGSISGLTITAVQGGNAIVSIYGEAVNDVTLANNTFDAGANTLGAVVYLNSGVINFEVEGNEFLGANLTASPLLGIEADNVQVTNNTFGEVAGSYSRIEVFAGLDGTTDDVVFAGNTGFDYCLV